MDAFHDGEEAADEEEEEEEEEEEPRKGAGLSRAVACHAALLPVQFRRCGRSGASAEGAK